MGELIRTGTAARILGTSRQHVVDLVNRGVLTNYGDGVHRRVDRSDVEAMGPTRRPADQRRRLWLHVGAAGELVHQPARSMARALANLAVVERDLGARTRATGRWLDLLAAGPEAILHAMLEQSDEADRLRQASPWLGLLGAADRRRLDATFAITDRPPFWTRPDQERAWRRRDRRPRRLRPLGAWPEEEEEEELS